MRTPAPGKGFYGKYTMDCICCKSKMAKKLLGLHTKNLSKGELVPIFNKHKGGAPSRPRQGGGN